MSSKVEGGDMTHLTEQQVPETFRRIAGDVLDTADRPVIRSVSLPAGAYTDESFHTWELRHVFAGEWLSVAHVSELPDVGDYLNLDVAGEPIVVVRGKDGVIRVLSRVCKHRAMDIMPPGFGREAKGHTRVLLCPYHYWGYDLDGQLKGCPEMHRVEDFSRVDVRLHEFRTETWEGFVFVNLDGHAPRLSPRLEPLREGFLGRWRMGEAKLVWDRQWDSAFNWKVLVENFMEPYHHMGTHARTLEPMMPSRGCWTEPPDPAFSAVHLPLSAAMLKRIDDGERVESFPLFPGLTPDDRRQWWVFLVYPTFLLFVAPDRFYWYRLLPTGPGTSDLTTTMLVPAAAAEMPDFDAVVEREAAGLVRIHNEDVEACVGVQRGLSSRGWSAGRLSHLEEPIWQFQQFLARKVRESTAADGMTTAAGGR